jgi:tRNA uridine 5-carboxymethylaminomethyl modification enzyme
MLVTIPAVDEFGVIVVGGGHAGCEAAHAAARLGVRTALVTLRLDQIAHMPCNPSIGGPAKGHLAREVDALGGLMGRVTDATYINLRLLNTGKGASVQALRAQSDRLGYAAEMQRILAATPHLTLVEGEVAGFLRSAKCKVQGAGLAADLSSAARRPQPQPATESQSLHSAPRQRIAGVVLADGRELRAPRVVICPGTFTRAECFMGERRHRAGRWGETSAEALGAALDGLGLPLHRLKTGTSPRIHKDSVDYTALTPQLSEWRDNGFECYGPRAKPPWFLPCWQTKTSRATKELLLANRQASALYSGAITGTGPRYCPSIEDKLVRFPEAETHPVFIEPDGRGVDILYLQGLSTSMPLDVQTAFLHTIPGLEAAKIKRPGYAVEYDAVNPIELTPQLDCRRVGGLYCAGQFNGTSGYEEAACQGLVAGANAALSLLGRPPLALARDNSYTGVLVDDLTTRGTQEPYRMLTARCEHRLLLRHDNAALRLGPIAREAGLLSKEQVAALDALRQRVWAVETELAARRVSVDEQAALGVQFRQAETRTARELVLRGVAVGKLLEAHSAARPDRLSGAAAPARQASRVPTAEAGPEARAAESFLNSTANATVEVELRYSAYLDKARAEAERLRAHEQTAIPAGFDYAGVHGLLKSSVESLSRLQPATLGQARRVPGVTPADAASLLLALRRAGAAEPLPA